MAYHPYIHHRRSIRLKGYDYAQEGLYFITLCCQNRTCLFGHIEKGLMMLNEYGKIAQEEWEKTPLIRGNVSLGAYIIMPNHMHGIIQINKPAREILSSVQATFQSPSHTIGAIIRGYKAATTTRIKKLYYGEDSKGEGSKGELQFAPTAQIGTDPADLPPISQKVWQRDYYEHIIRNEQAYHNISQYIINNPKKWEEDSLYKKNKG